ncbi:hypothetical protein OEK23_003580 [Vibrio cholerae]|nr:hypothetical protein [Vibrio cholerae]
MKAAIITEIHHVKTEEGLVKAIREGSIVSILDKGKPVSIRLVSHEFCQKFHVLSRFLQPIDGEVLKIDWLNRCPKCDAKVAYVETESTDSSYLFEGDKVHCAQCDKKGAIEVIDCECVECVWDEEA